MQEHRELWWATEKVSESEVGEVCEDGEELEEIREPAAVRDGLQVNGEGLEEVQG